jgi:hypothetical protein
MGAAAHKPAGTTGEASLLAALHEDPNAAVALELSRLYVDEGRPLDALHRLDVVAIHNSADPAHHDEACRLLVKIGDFEAAVRQAARGLALTGNSQLLTRHERALRRLIEETTLGVSPRLKRTYLKGLVRLLRGRSAAAAELFEKVVRQAPTYVPAWIGLRGALEAQFGPSAGAAVAERWGTAAPTRGGEISVAMGRTLAANGLVFDPRQSAAFVSIHDALTPVGSLEALQQTPRGVLMLDPGGVEVTCEPILSGSGGGTRREPVRYRTAEVFITGLENAALLGRGIVMTDDGVVPRELHSVNLEKYGARDLGDRIGFDPAMFQGGLGEVRVFDTPALLMCAATDKSFGDWMINFMPRLKIARRAGLNCPVVISANAPEPFIALLRAFGVGDKEIIVHERTAVSLFRKLYVPSWPMREFLQPMDGLFDIFRDIAGEPSPGPGRRLYLSREQIARRGMVNEPEVRALFERHGFEVVHPQQLSLARMRELMADAACIAAPYGSALLNLAYAGRRPVSIVCQPPQKPGFLAQLALWQASMGLTFAYVLGEPLGPPGAHPPKDAPWVAPLPELEATVKTVLAGLGLS